MGLALGITISITGMFLEAGPERAMSAMSVPGVVDVGGQDSEPEVELEKEGVPVLDPKPRRKKRKAELVSIYGDRVRAEELRRRVEALARANHQEAPVPMLSHDLSIDVLKQHCRALLHRVETQNAALGALQNECSLLRSLLTNPTVAAAAAPFASSEVCQLWLQCAANAEIHSRSTSESSCDLVAPASSSIHPALTPATVGASSAVNQHPGVPSTRPFEGLTSHGLAAVSFAASASQDGVGSSNDKFKAPPNQLAALPFQGLASFPQDAPALSGGAQSSSGMKKNASSTSIKSLASQGSDMDSPDAFLESLLKSSPMQAVIDTATPKGLSVQLLSKAADGHGPSFAASRLRASAVAQSKIPGIASAWHSSLRV